VVVSACESGLGDVTTDEGNRGLERAFKLAGADNLLVSLWEVQPSATSQLLVRFYGNWARGMAPGDALNQAERSLQKDPTRKHPLSPYRWASFVLIE
jgi:CHAT domain-containing protein